MAFAEIWCTIYVAFSNPLRAGQRSALTAGRWNKLKKLNAFELRLSGVQAHSSSGIGERLHYSVQRICKKIINEYSDVSQGVVMRTTLKEVRDTIGENGSDLTRISFEMKPGYPNIMTQIPPRKENASFDCCSCQSERHERREKGQDRIKRRGSHVC